MIKPFHSELLAFMFGRPPVKLPILLKKERIYILPTGRGLLFTVVILAMIFGSLNYNNNAGFLFAFLLSSMCMISTLYTQKNLASLTISSEKHNPVFAGEKLWFELAIRSEKNRRYKISAGFPKQEEMVKDVPHKENTLFRVPIETTTRGVFQPRRLVLSTTYPFGLFRTWVVLNLNTDYVVFPEPSSHPFVASSLGSRSEGTGASGTPGSDDFRELKTYQPGDPMNRISWKSYARGQGLWTRTFEAEQGPPIYFNWNDLTATDREKRISQLTFLITEAHRTGKDFGLILPGITITPEGTGSLAHRNRCLTALAMMPAEVSEAQT